jgi:Predicted transcriptional regulators
MNKIRKLRIERGYSQKELATQLENINQSSLSQIERGLQGSNSLDNIIQFSRFFGVSIDYLVGESNEK